MTNILTYLSSYSLYDIILICLSLLFLIEQIFYWRIGSYLYRFGLLVTSIQVSYDQISSWRNNSLRYCNIIIKDNSQKKEMYFNYKYPGLMIGPLLFVGQLKYKQGKYLNIRVGIIAAAYIVYLLIYPLFTLVINFNTVLNLLLLLLLVSWLYFSLLKSLNVSLFH
jgi:hypothetical protein